MSLRIATGKLRNRELFIPPAEITRPASSRVREAIVNVLQHNPDVAFKSFEGLTVLDAYAGSGAVGFEMLSNGVECVTFCENHPRVLEVLRANIEKLGVEEQTTISACACQQFSQSDSPRDIVFIDPPYNKGELATALQHLVETNWIGKQTRVVIEHAKNEDVSWPVGMQTVFKRAYGQPVIHIGKYL